MILDKCEFYNKSVGENLCVFASFDVDSIVDDHVLFYLDKIKNDLDCDIVFVTTSDKLNAVDKKNLSKTVKTVIHRKNIGYDFGSYFVGYNYVKQQLSSYKNIIFANDSVFCLSGLKNVKEKLDSVNFDVLGMTDNLVPRYHVQSYFFSIKLSKNNIGFLDDFWSEFRFVGDYNYIVKNYEIGFSQKALKKGFKVRSTYSHEDIINKRIDVEEDDSFLCLVRDNNEENSSQLYKGVKFNIVSEGFWSYKFAKKMLRKFCSRKKDILFKTISNPMANDWYILISYFSCPMIKVKFLKDYKSFFQLHLFQYEKVVKNSFPNCDINLIRGYLHRTASIEE